MRTGWIKGGALALLGAGVGAAALPVALTGVAAGRWQLHEIGRPETTRSVCVANTGQLMQLRHGARRCTQTVLSQTPRSATVHYICPGAGHGQTILTAESPKVIRLQTQGIAEGQPFDLDVEARRLGTC
jgi:hypothetical protein